MAVGHAGVRARGPPCCLAEDPMAIYRWMGTKFTDQERGTIARGWAASGLPQDQYAASYGVTGRALRGWMVKFAPSEPPLECIESLLIEMMERLQAVLDGVRFERAALEDRAEGRAVRSESPSRTTTVAGVFQQEHQPEPLRPRRHRVEPVEDAHPVRPRRGSFFQDFGSD